MDKEVDMGDDNINVSTQQTLVSSIIFSSLAHFVLLEHKKLILCQFFGPSEWNLTSSGMCVFLSRININVLFWPKAQTKSSSALWDEFTLSADFKGNVEIIRYSKKKKKRSNVKLNLV